MKIKLTIFFLALTLGLNAQEQHVESSSGGQYFFSTGSMVWTVGEVVINTIQSPDNHITQGFNQSRIEFVGIEEYSIKIDINVFPNPTTDFVNVIASKKTTLSIYDTSQKLISQKSLEKQDKVDLSDLSSGTYLLVFSKNNKKIKTIKIIVQK
jgi:hypothetical protein